MLTLGFLLILVPDECSWGTHPVWLAYWRALSNLVKFLVSRMMADAVTHDMPGTLSASSVFSLNSSSSIRVSRISFSKDLTDSIMAFITFRRALDASEEAFDVLPEKLRNLTSHSFSILLVRWSSRNFFRPLSGRVHPFALSRCRQAYSAIMRASSLSVLLRCMPLLNLI
ncbi:unknown [Bacteroides sp. CAG:661]|nr:unknown [Bacteroides sp. CAG:661]